MIELFDKIKVAASEEGNLGKFQSLLKEFQEGFKLTDKEVAKIIGCKPSDVGRWKNTPEAPSDSKRYYGKMLDYMAKTLEETIKKNLANFG